jgi:inorganic triphosphatase YgiF
VSKTTSHREIELKFRVPSELERGAPIDVLAVLQSLGLNVDAHDTRSMVATYYDTPDLTLLRWGITLRSRHGGGDDGWHLKVPAEPSGRTPARDEIHIDADATSVPSEIIAIVSPLLRRQELHPMALVRTERTPFVITGEDQIPLIEAVDDRVAVQSHAAGDSGSSFHEIEVELLEDTQQAHKTAERISRSLLDAGAAASSVSKAAQALGSAAGDPPDVPDLPFPGPTAPSIDCLQAIFASFCRDLLMADVGVRRGLPDSVHQMRVACRRLRSALKTGHRFRRLPAW